MLSLIRQKLPWSQHLVPLLEVLRFSHVFFCRLSTKQERFAPLMYAYSNVYQMVSLPTNSSFYDATS